MSTFFKYFPQISITVKPPKSTAESLHTSVLPDIFSGYTLPNRYKTNTIYFTMYTIQDGETPNSLAYKLYGSEGYGWLILLLNDITNFTEQWPLSNQQLEAYVDEKYQTNNGSQVLFLNYGYQNSMTGFQSFFPGSFVEFFTSNGGAYGGQAFVWDWSPTYRRLILTEGYTGDNLNLLYDYYSGSSTSAFTVNIDDINYMSGKILQGTSNSAILPLEIRSPVDDFFKDMAVSFHTSVGSASSTSALTITNYEAGTGRIFFNPTITDGKIPQPSGVINSVICQSLTNQLPMRDVFTITVADSGTQAFTFGSNIIGKIINSVKDSLAYFSDDPSDLTSPILSPYSSSSVTGGLLDQYISGSELVQSKIVTFEQHERNVNESKRQIKVLKPQYVQEVVRTISTYFGK